MLYFYFMRQVVRYYALLVAALLARRNPNYSPQQWPWYVVMALSVPVGFLLLGPLSLWTHSFGPLLPPGAVSDTPWVDQLGTLGALLVYPIGPAFALHYWLVFRSEYVRTVVLPAPLPRRYVWQALGIMATCYALFVLMSSWHRLFLK